MNYDQRGISLVLTFLIMSIMLAIVLGVSSILSGQITVMANAGNSISALYAAETGLERALYISKKCPTCNLNYEGSFDGRTYSIDAKVKNGVLEISSRGDYKGTSRTVYFSK